jgi:hypothetical protein
MNKKKTTTKTGKTSHHAGTERVAQRLYNVIKEEDAKADVDAAALIVGLAWTMAQLVRQGYAEKDDIRGAIETALKHVKEYENCGGDEEEGEND